MEHFSLRLAIPTLLSFVVLCNSAKFDVCEEKAGIVQKAKATQLAAKLVDKCALPIVSKYKFSTKMIQRAASKMCVVFRFCWHKYAPLKKSKEWIDAKNLEDPRGLYYDGVNCTRIHNIFTDDAAIGLSGIKWVRDTLF
ncbi:uncharacterized protein [Dermacentor andersoni]|uniref:uncharacterized protein isoform X3 n=1 Tax=Dermacentor andersoni TaxID=34620 RepID=UPI002416E1B7|nr:uncharacterized protein LOC129380644 isoform X2 [Dermacentor andersoni]